MKTWLRDLLDALLLRGATLARLADRSDAMFRGFVVIVVVALFVGLPALAGEVIGGFQPPAIVEPGDVTTGAGASLDLVRPWLRSSGMPESMIDAALLAAEGNSALAAGIAAQVEQLPTALPRPLARTFVGLGHWLSRPFANVPLPLATAALSTWLGYGVWVMLAAKLLGGRGTLHGFFGATAFFVVPHVLDVFAGVPVVGPLLGLIALFWGLVIYVVATAASHRLSAGRAVVAVFAPVVLLLTLLALFLLALTLWAVVVGMGNVR